MTTLKYGSRGETVKQLQRLLGITADGVFGKKTREAVRKYQTAQNLAADGIVGPKTWDKLLGTNDAVLGKRPPDNKQYDPRWANVMYSIRNDKSQTIKSSGCGPTAMCNIINAWFDTTVTPVDLCKIAVKKGYRTSDDGTAWGFFKYMSSQYAFSSYESTNVHDDAIAVLAKGCLIVASMGKGYWTKQGHFITLWKCDGSYMYACDPASSTRTKQNLKDFKKQVKKYFIFGPPIDDVVDEPDVSEAPPIPSTPVQRDLFRGMSGNDVTELQNNLIALGYKVGAAGADGKFGTDTEIALTLFQKIYELPVNGKYDAVTRAKMAEVIAKKKANGEYVGPTGIYDISKWQGSIDFRKVKESNKVALFVVRAGYGQNTKDERFDEYMREIAKYQIPFAVYWFSYAASAENAEKEMDSFYRIASPYKPLFYVLDAEDRRVDGSFINAAAKRLKAISGNHKTGLYVANHLFSEYKSEGMDTALWDFIWIPKYTATPPSHRPCDWWQKEGTKVPGIRGSVDTNYIPASGRYDLIWYLTEGK